MAFSDDAGDDRVARFQKQLSASYIGGPLGDIDNFVYQQWCKSDWGSLLQPAPTAGLILYKLSMVASVVDFALIPPARGFNYVKYPDSFRATIVQLVDTGANDFKKSYRNFDEIGKRCAAVEPAVKSIVSLLAGSGAKSRAEATANIRMHLPRVVSQLQVTVEKCRTQAMDTQKMFDDLLNQTMEIHQSCTATQGMLFVFIYGDILLTRVFPAGSNEAKIADAEMRRSILEAERLAAEENKRIVEQQERGSREAFRDAQEQFNKASKNMPGAFTILALNTVENLSHAAYAVATGTAQKISSVSQATKACVCEAINRAAGVERAPEPPIVPSDELDPGYQRAQTIAGYATALEAIMKGGPNGGIDWDSVAAKTGESGAAHLRGMMQVTLGCKWEDGQGSAEAKALLESGIQLVEALRRLAPMQQQDEVRQLSERVQQYMLEAMKFAVIAAAKTGTSPLRRPGFAAPLTPPNLSSGTAMEIAVRSGQYKLEAAQRQLDASRQMSKDSTEKLLEAQKHMGEVLAQIAQINVEKIDWGHIRDILKRAISFLCKQAEALKSCLTDIVHFFNSVNTLVGVTMGETVSEFIGLISDTTASQGDPSLSRDKVLGGVLLSDWTRQAIFQQAIGAAQVASFVKLISQIYVKMYDGHVQVGIKKLFEVGQSMGVTSFERHQALRAGEDIQEWATGASLGIQSLIREEQERMQKKMQDRLDHLQSSLVGILPPPPAAVQSVIADTTHAQIEEASAAHAVEAEADPMFRPDLDMTF